MLSYYFACPLISCPGVFFILYLSHAPIIICMLLIGALVPCTNIHYHRETLSVVHPIFSTDSSSLQDECYFLPGKLLGLLFSIPNLQQRLDVELCSEFEGVAQITNLYCCWRFSGLKYCLVETVLCLKMSLEVVKPPLCWCLFTVNIVVILTL